MEACTDNLWNNLIVKNWDLFELQELTTYYIHRVKGSSPSLLTFMFLPAHRLRENINTVSNNGGQRVFSKPEIHKFNHYLADEKTPHLLHQSATPLTTPASYYQDFLLEKSTLTHGHGHRHVAVALVILCPSFNLVGVFNRGYFHENIFLPWFGCCAAEGISASVVLIIFNIFYDAQPCKQESCLNVGVADWAF